MVELVMIQQNTECETRELEYISQNLKNHQRHSRMLSVDKLTYISNLKSEGTSSLELLDVKMNSNEPFS